MLGWIFIYLFFSFSKKGGRVFSFLVCGSIFATRFCFLWGLWCSTGENMLC